LEDDMAMVTARARAVMVTGSALFWGGLGYLALTQAPRFITWSPPEGPIIVAEPRVKPIVPPKIDLPKPEPIKQVKDAIIRPPEAPPVLRTRATPTRNIAVDAPASDIPTGNAPLAPALGTGDGIETVEPGPTLVLPSELALTTIPEPAPELAAKEPPRPPLVLNPVRITGSSPTFPTRALERGVEGEVVLAFTVAANGQVESLSIVSESPSGYGFGRAALAAFRNWQFQPQTIDGVAVAYPARYTISFKLED
jgi:periplasmic protein TonB